MTALRRVELQRYAVPDTAHTQKFTDTIEIDQEALRLYAVDNWSGGVDVFDISTTEPRYLSTIRARGNLFGLALAPDLRKLFVGLAGSVLAVIDVDPASPTVDTIVARIDTGGRGAVDLLDYAPVHQKIYAANRNDGFMTSVDAVNNAIVKRIDGLGGGLEQPRFNPHDGMVYLAGNTDDVLYQVDPVTDTLVHTYQVDRDCHPNGLAINPETNQALLACARPRTVIWDFGTQSVATVIEESGGGDGAIYEATVDRFFFAASGAPGGPAMGIFGGNPVRLLGNVPTARGASWVAYDRRHGLVYAPTFEGGKPGLISFPLDL